MTFIGSAMTSTESEVMTENVGTNALSCSRHVTYGRYERAHRDEKGRNKWRQMAGRGVRM